MQKQIFTFWEPAETIFPYLHLCMETWRKYYPDYDIHIVSYENLFDFIDENLYDFAMLKKYSLPMQADAIRVALLHKYGGMWLDCDTIITDRQFFNLFNEDIECGMVGIASQKLPHIGIIKAQKGAELLDYWLGEIQKRLAAGNEGLKKADWAYLGNGIINPYIKTLDASLFECIDKDMYYIVPEENFRKENKYSLRSPDNYRYFWFENDFSRFLTGKRLLGISLHNSWTPPFIKGLSQDDFLRTECTLASLLTTLLEIPLQKKVFYWNCMRNEFSDMRNVNSDDIYNICIDGLNYKMYLPDKQDVDQSLIINHKKPREMDVLGNMRSLMADPENTVLIDIGHNCGNHTAYFAALGVEVHAFDPNRHLAKILEKTIEINNFSNVHLYNVGLGDHEYTTSFQKINSHHSGGMSLKKGGQSLCDISVIPLDSLKLSFPYKKIVVKMDVEGMELSVLRGMVKTLEEFRPEALFIEIHTIQQLKSILEFLSPYGYVMDCMMESHTCKFIQKRSNEMDVFISEQRFFMKEFFDILGRFEANINKQKHDIFWNCLLFNQECVLPDTVYISQDTGKHYLQIYIQGIPTRVHYELLRTPRTLQCCLHCEDATLVPAYKDFFEKLARTLESQCIVGNTLQINIDVSAGNCLSVLKKMIALSLDEIKAIGGKI